MQFEKHFQNLKKIKSEVQGKIEKKGTLEISSGADGMHEAIQEVVQFLSTPEKFQKLGGRIPKGVLLVGPPGAGFNMTALGLRLSGCRNAVTKRHAEVSRKMWQSLWPEVPEDQVPIDYVTNGVHVPTWIEPKIKLLLDKYLGADWLDKHDDPAIWQILDNVPDSELWQTHHWLKVKLIDAIRERTRQRWANGDASASIMLAGVAGIIGDPDGKMPVNCRKARL